MLKIIGWTLVSLPLALGFAGVIWGTVMVWQERGPVVALAVFPGMPIGAAIGFFCIQIGIELLSEDR